MISRRQKTRKTIILISFLFFPATYYYLSPYLIIDATVKGIISGSFIFFALLFVSSLFLGRAFCGWVCPAGGGQDLIIEIKNKKVRKGKLIKWFIWIPWITIIIILSLKNGGYHQINPFYQTTYGFSIGDVFALITYLLVLMLIVVPAFLVGRRSFCHSICWMAPFMILGRKLRNLIKIPALQLKAIPVNCVHCGTCEENCPMSLEVEKMVESQKMEKTDCILCGTCIDGCKSKAIDFDYHKPIN